MYGYKHRQRRPNRGGGGRLSKKRFGTIATLLTVLAVIFVGSGSTAAFAGGNQEPGDTHTQTVAWDGQHGASLADPACKPGQGSYWHWILTPPGGTTLVSGTLTVNFESESTIVAEGAFRNAGGNGAMHFDVARPSPDVVQGASVTFTYQGGGGNFVLTISDSSCEGTPTPPTDVCPNIDGNQSEIPSGMVKNDAGDCVTPPPADQCTDGSNPGDLNGDGKSDADDCNYTPPTDQCRDGSNPGDANGDGTADEQDCNYTPPPTCDEGQVLNDNGDCVTPPTECADGQVLDESGTCVTPPPEECDNGQVMDDSGKCVTPPTDVCPNIDGNQSEIPSGMVKNDAGDCVTPPPADACPDMEGNQPPGTDCTPPATCPPGTTWNDTNDNGTVEEGECESTPPTIKQCDTITGSTKVTPSSLHGFDFSETRSTGHYEFTADGLHIWTEGNTSTDKVAGYKQVNVPLSEVGQPSLDYTNNGGVAPGYQLYLDNGHGVTGFVVGEPSPYGDNWWSTKDFGVGSGMGYASYGTLNDYLAANPDAVVKAFGFSLGSGVKGDGVLHKITFGCQQWVFTKDTTPPPPPATPQEVTPAAPTVTKPSCDHPAILVTPSSQEGVVWSPNGPTVLLPNQHVTYTASPAEGYVFPEGVRTSWTLTNDFDVLDCVVTPPNYGKDLRTVASCGQVQFVNDNDFKVYLFYGSADEVVPDNQNPVIVPAHGSKVVKTKRTVLDFEAFGGDDSTFLDQWDSVKVPQHCGTKPPKSHEHPHGHHGHPTPVPPTTWPTPSVPTMPTVYTNVPTSAETGHSRGSFPVLPVGGGLAVLLMGAAVFVRRGGSRRVTEQ